MIKLSKTIVTDQVLIPVANAFTGDAYALQQANLMI